MFWQELRKIFTLKTILAIFLINFLLYKLIIEFDLENFPNGEPAGTMVSIEKELITQFGATIDDAELTIFTEKYEELKEESNQFLKEVNAEKGLNFTDVGEFWHYDLDRLNSSYDNMLSYIERGTNYMWQLQAYETYIHNYRYEEASLNNALNALSGNRKAIIQKYLDQNKYTFYQDYVLSNFKTYSVNVAITLFISVTILLANVFLRDKRANVVALQYTSKKGRKLFNTKWLAGMVSGVLLVVVLGIIYSLLYVTNGTGVYFDLPVYAMSFYYYWIDVTFLQFMLIRVGFIVVSAICVAAFVLALSNFVKTRIGLSIGTIIIIIIMILYSVFIIEELFNLNFPRLLGLGVLCGMLLVTLVVNIYYWKREMTKDIE